jgi:hypothetical protein
VHDFSTKVRLKISNQGLVDPDQVFNRDDDGDENYSYRPGSIRIRIPDPRIHGIYGIFRGAVIFCAFGRRNSGADGVRERPEKGGAVLGVLDYSLSEPGKKVR